MPHLEECLIILVAGLPLPWEEVAPQPGDRVLEEEVLLSFFTFPACWLIHFSTCVVCERLENSDVAS